MKARILSACFVLVCAARIWGQSNGQITLANRFLVLPSGDTYHAPVWIDLNGTGTLEPGEGIGSYAAAIGQTATLALYLRDTATPLATALFRSDLNGQFLGNPASQTVAVPGYAPGQSAPLTIKAWIGASYETAFIRASWDFTSPPLGGAPPDGGVPILTPSVSNWGEPNSSGFALTSPAGPIAGSDTIMRRTLSDSRVSIEALLSDDIDPNGGSVAFVGVNPVSNSGAVIAIVGDDILYRSPAGPAAPDHFFYSVRNAVGGVGRGRVDVVINDPEGMIELASRNIPTLSGTATYNTPIYVDANSDGAFDSTESIGSFAALYYNTTAKLGLFLKNSGTPVAVSAFHINALASYLGNPESQIVVIPGAAPGAQVELTIKAWIGDTYEVSRVKGSWDFTSLPLGGIVAAGPVFPIPGLTGWGSEDNSGYGLSAGPAPVAVADEFTRPYRQNGTITIETLLANDTDPEGGALSFVAADPTSANGARVTVLDSAITYKHASDAADHFFYSVRNSRGVVARGRVDVRVGDPVGEILISNRAIPKVEGDGTYDVPVWVDVDFNSVQDSSEGVGSYAWTFAQNAMFGVFIQGSLEPFATAKFSREMTSSAFLDVPGGTNVLVPGSTPGQRVPLTVKVWVGPSYETAFVKGSWDFESLPLGGPRTGDTPLPIPSLTGWGPETGAGFGLAPGIRPIVGHDIVQIYYGDVIRIPIQFLFQNDADPNGGTLTFISHDMVSTGGANIVFFGGTLELQTRAWVNDSFTYSVATPLGGVATAEVSLELREGPAKIFLANRLVRRSFGEGVYNIPVWVDENFNGKRDRGEGIGAFASKLFGQTAMLGLFQRDGAVPLAKARFNSEAAGAFLEEPAFQEVVV